MNGSEKELLTPFWTPSRSPKKQNTGRKRKSEGILLGAPPEESDNRQPSRSLSPSSLAQHLPKIPEFKQAKANTMISPRKLIRPMTPNSEPRSPRDKPLMGNGNRILWFLQNFPKVILQSAATQKYIIAKARKKNTAQMKVWKGKPPVELLATCQYRGATDAYSKTSECFETQWDAENNQIAFGVKKDKCWVVDQYDVVRPLRSVSQFDQKFFEITLHGDFFSLRCPVTSKYIGVNEYDQQLECKQNTVSTAELFKLRVKAALRLKSTLQYLSVRPDSVQASCTSNEIGSLETLVLEIGGANCRIYSCAGVSQRSHRRYLSCWKDKNIEGTWHLGFPLHGHDQSDMGSLIEEQFEIIYKEDNYYCIRACNDHYISWNGSRLQASATIPDDTCLFQLVCHSKRKKKVTKNFMAIYSTASMPTQSQQPSGVPPPIPERPHALKTTKSLNDSHCESYYSEEQDDTIIPHSVRENYRKSVLVFMKNGIPKVARANIPNYSTAQYVEDDLLFKEVVLAQIPSVAESTDTRCTFGCFFVTNYRVIFVPDEVNDREGLRWSLPLISLSQVVALGQIELEDGSSSCFAFELIGKHWLQPESARRRITSGYHLISTAPISVQSDNDPTPVIQLIHQLSFPEVSEIPLQTQYFAFTHRSGLLNDEGWNIYHVETEYMRQIRKYNDSQKKWMIFTGNKDYSICPSYPKIMVQPYGITNQEIKAIASHRSKMRIPAVTWIHPTNGAAFLRCSQPKQGWRSTKSTTEGKYFSLICSVDNPLIWIMDARPQINAMANRLKGAGYEDLEHYREETYTVRIKFLGIGNIHVMRDSLRRLQKICLEESKSEKFASVVLSSCWFDHLRLLLKSSQRIANKIHGEGQTVVLHCSDGWDRTAQLASVSQLIMDGYFRTVKGFCVLMEKDWLSFGHKFADRTGQGDSNYKCKERSPIFVQFIDCTWQLIQQQPTCFEFNEWFLLTILEHVYSGRFGTFLYNTPQERDLYDVRARTHSLWNILINRNMYLNSIYDPSTCDHILNINPSQVTLWKTYYVPNS